MKRLLILSCCCLAFHLRGQEASSTNAATSPRTVQRFLLLVDTSSAMSRQKTVTTDTVSRLILSGIGGRIQLNDFWNVWTIDDQLHTNVIPMQRWDPQQRGDLANRVFRHLHDLRFNKKRAVLEKSLAAMAEEAALPGTLTVILFTDGSKPVKGTPFDESINEIFTKHAAGMQKAKKPFVVVFVTQDGRFAAHAVSPGGEQIYIPRLPKPVAIAKKPVATENPAPGSKPARTLTAEEISELLRQPQKQQSNAVALTPAPLIIRGGFSQTNPVAPDTSSKAAAQNLPQAQPSSLPTSSTTPPLFATNILAFVPASNAITSAPTSSTSPPVLASNTTASVPASNTNTSVPIANTTQPVFASTPIASVPASNKSAPVAASNTAPAPEQSASVVPALPARTAPSAPTDVNRPGSGNAITPPPPDDRPPVAAAETTVDETREEIAHSPAPAQTAAIAQHEPLANAPVYLMAAVALLLVAVLMGWLYIRSIRYVPRPSLISRSLEKERK
jgi:hypothetical protein